MPLSHAVDGCLDSQPSLVDFTNCFDIFELREWKDVPTVSVALKSLDVRPAAGVARSSGCSEICLRGHGSLR